MGNMSKINQTNRKVIIREDGSVKVVSQLGTETRVDQSFKDSTDINHIMKKYRNLGYDYNSLPDATKGLYADWTKMKTYQESLNGTIQVMNSFMKLPSDIRKRFSNDPTLLTSWLLDAKNKEEAIKLGLIKAPPPPPDLNVDLNIKTEPKK